MARSSQTYSANGVTISKSTISVGDKLELSYNGLLAQHGAQQIFAHYGYGETWEENGWIEMHKDGSGFKTTLDVKRDGSLNLCFKDAIDNWDNNSSLNYTFGIASKSKAKSTKTTATKSEAKTSKSAVVTKETKATSVDAEEKKAKKVKATTTTKKSTK